MGEGVAKIEKRPLARFALIRADNAGLRTATDEDRFAAELGAAPDEMPSVRFEPGKEFRVVDEAVLHDLRVAGQEFAPGKLSSNPTSASTSRG